MLTVGIKRSSHGSEPPHKFQRIERQQMPQSLHSAWQIEQNMCYLPPFGYAVNDENQGIISIISMMIVLTYLCQYPKSILMYTSYYLMLKVYAKSMHC